MSFTAFPCVSHGSAFLLLSSFIDLIFFLASEMKVKGCGHVTPKGGSGMFQPRTTITVGFCLALVLLAMGAGPARAGITSITPADGSTLTSDSQAFSWTGMNNDAYWLYVGTTVGGSDIYNKSLATATSATVTGLPTDGSTVYLRLWFVENGGPWQFVDYTYTAFTAGGGGGSAGNPTLRWDRILDSTNGDANGCNSDRFKCIFPTAANPTGEAVLDLETGLVWERSQDSTSRSWAGAISHCAKREVGGRKGWSLPIREQLASLVATNTTSGGPVIDDGHPFQNVHLDFYWSATRSVLDPTFAWWVNFRQGFIDEGDTANTHRVWCVRGGQSFDGNTAASHP